MAVKYLNISEAEFLASKSVHKFLSLERALQLLESKKLWFSNPVIWKDPYEQRFILGTYDGGKKFTWLGRVYCMCITPIATSEASWKAYSKEDFAVKFEFDRVEYVNILNNVSSQPGVMDVFLGTMDYQQTRKIERRLSEIEFSDNIKLPITSKFFKARLLLLKRKAFRYEGEFRAIIVKNKKSGVDGITVDIPDIMKLVKSITIDPNIGEKEFEMIRNHLISKFHFDKKQIMKSRLYEASTNPRIKN